jgi:hypothetical protein
MTNFSTAAALFPPLRPWAPGAIFRRHGLLERMLMDNGTLMVTSVGSGQYLPAHLPPDN